MKAKIIIALCIALLGAVQPQLASARGGCLYYENGKKKTAPNKTYIRFDDGLNQCKNGSWVGPSKSKTDKQSDRAVSIVCFDGQYRSCKVTWSSGKRTLGSEYGSRSGGIVASTTYTDLSGRRWCVNLYAGGGIKYAGWC